MVKHPYVNLCITKPQQRLTITCSYTTVNVAVNLVTQLSLRKLAFAS